MIKRPKNLRITYFLKNLYIVVGIVLIWRGVWYVLDIIDENFFDGGRLWTAVAGIVLGLVFLYLPDQDLKEIGK